MEQRSRHPARRKIHPYVPDQLVKDSEDIYRQRVAAGARGASPTKVQADWATVGWLLSRAVTAREASKIVRDFRAGKPLALPSQTEGGA